MLVDDEIRRMIDELCLLDSGLDDWECNFVNDVATFVDKAFKRNGTAQISKRQHDKLVEIWEKMM